MNQPQLVIASLLLRPDDTQPTNVNPQQSFYIMFEPKDETSLVGGW